MKKIYFGISLVVLFVCSFIYEQRLPVQRIEESESQSYVILSGAFLQEGTFYYEGELNVSGLVNQVGVSKDANLSCLNMTQTLTDEQSIYLPILSENTISLNTSSLQQLMSLKGVGEKTAQKIIDYREATPFLFIEDIMKISGIGEKTFIKLRDQLCL